MRGNPRPKSGTVVVDYIYPAIFEHDEEDGPDVWSATFPDWQPGYTGVTSGESLSDAMYMAADLLSGMILGAVRDGEELPEPSSLHELNIMPTPNRFASLVSSKIARTKSIEQIARVDCTMPDWLKWEAKDKGINFSKTLQEALLEKLEITVVGEVQHYRKWELEQEE